MSGKYFSKQVKYHKWSVDDGENLLKQSLVYRVLNLCMDLGY